LAGLVVLAGLAVLAVEVVDDAVEVFFLAWPLLLPLAAALPAVPAGLPAAVALGFAVLVAFLVS
jgi:hypothetical protein